MPNKPNDTVNSDTAAEQPTNKATVQEAATTQSNTATGLDSDVPSNASAVDASVKAESSPTEPANQATVTDNPIDNLVWADVLQQLADQDRPSTLSLVQQCDYRYNPDDNTLTLYFGKTFHRKQAKTQTFNEALSSTLDELYHTRPAIEISDESAPADSDVAAVLRVVGGEVTTISDGTI